MFRWLGRIHSEVPLLITVPHSGERVPSEAAWLAGLSAEVLLTDVDRFVDRLYGPACEELPVPMLVTEVHRYAADLNRYPDDVDSRSVIGASAPAGTFSWGFHWVETTRRDALLPSPIARGLHDEIVRKYHDAFHERVAKKLGELRQSFPGREIYHLDCHSMPSQGTAGHADAGQKRAEVVISDSEGKSSGETFRSAVLDAFRREGFEISLNWPYKGGRITQRYGQPERGHHTIQIELNRALYMNEATREALSGFGGLPERLKRTLSGILARLSP